MSCERPIRMRNPRYNDMQSYQYWNDYYKTTYDVSIPDEYISVPCGECHSCRASKRRGWLIRLLSEYNRYPNSIFITLTFDNANLNRFRYKPNRAVRLFLDRMRKYFGKQVRHFIIGEFGEKTGRFHYHGILFNVPSSLDDVRLARLWSYGFVYIGWCTQATIHYILKYIVKDNDKAPSKVPRLIVSQGIGENFVDDYLDSPIKQEYQPYLTRDGKRIPLPRYLRDKLYDVDELAMMNVARSFEPFVGYVAGVRYDDEIKYKEALEEFSRNQIALGVSPPPKKRKKHSALKPISADDVRYISPLDTLDFYSPNENKTLESCFSLEETPF